MANILLTNKCNLDCSYCFARESISNIQDEISIENFNKAIDFIKKDGTDEIGLIGGEPLLHSKFTEIIKILKNDNAINKVMIYTNGIELNKYFDILNTEKFYFLINCNSAENLGDKYNKLKDNIKLFNNSNKAVLGINIYSGDKDNDYIFDLLKDFQNKILRLSVSFSNREKNETDDVLKKFREIKPIVFNLLEKCIKNNIVPYYDCNSIPNCILSVSDKRIILQLQQIAEKMKIKYSIISSCKNCNPVIDILPDLTAIRCFSFPEYKKTDISQFNSLKQLNLYFYNQIDIFAKTHFINEQCEDCKYRLYNKCGICYSYKRFDNKTIIK